MYNLLPSSRPAPILAEFADVIDILWVAAVVFGCLALIIHSPNHAQISHGVSNVFPLYFSPYFCCISTALSHVSSSSPIRAHLSFVFWQRHAFDRFSTLAFSCYFVRLYNLSVVETSCIIALNSFSSLVLRALYFQ